MSMFVINVFVSSALWHV